MTFSAMRRRSNNWLLLLAASTASMLLAFVTNGGELAKFRRDVPKLPTLVASEPLYSVFVFGKNIDRPIWAVLDKSSSDSILFDVLYLDLNGDGDLTAKAERFTPTEKAIDRKEGTNTIFKIDRFVEPGSRREHKDFKITWRPGRVSYRIKWLGDKETMGPYGPTPEESVGFAKSLSAAPVMVPGLDRPFQFQPWLPEALKRGRENDFKVFMGNIGDGVGSFCSVDNKFLPADDFVVATLIYREQSGAQRQERFELKKRC
jgi:hypothetical protein